MDPLLLNAFQAALQTEHLEQKASCNYSDLVDYDIFFYAGYNRYECLNAQNANVQLLCTRTLTHFPPREQW